MALIFKEKLNKKEGKNLSILKRITIIFAFFFLSFTLLFGFVFILSMILGEFTNVFLFIVVIIGMIIITIKGIIAKKVGFIEPTGHIHYRKGGKSVFISKKENKWLYWLLIVSYILFLVFTIIAIVAKFLGRL